MKKTLKLGLSGLLVALCVLTLHFYSTRLNPLHAETLPENQLALLQVPSGMHIEQVADLSSYGKPRMMTLDSQGRLLITLVNTGRVVRVDPRTVQASVEVIAEGLRAPNGIDMLGEDILVAESEGIVKLPKQGDRWGAPQALIQRLPTGGHGLKSVKVSPDGFLFINVGSSCNACIEYDPLRATILRYTAEGKPAGALLTLGRHAQSAIWARGLRNSQGFAWHPETGAFFATNEGADNRSTIKGGAYNDELPPEHLNIIEAGNHYGWPYCWGDPEKADGWFQDPNIAAEPGICSASQPPALTMTAHSTPIGITFLHKSRFEPWKQDAVIAFHGSWNRKQPSGYALMRVQFRNQKPVATLPLVTGWLQNNQAWGRPVDVIVGHDGWLYISDDLTGWIYRLRARDARIPS